MLDASHQESSPGQMLGFRGGPLARLASQCWLLVGNHGPSAQAAASVVAGFPQRKWSQSRVEAVILYDLTSEVTRHRFCNILSVTQVSPVWHELGVRCKGVLTGKENHRGPFGGTQAVNREEYHRPGGYLPTR